MTYPSGAALLKHDLVVPQAMPREDSLLMESEFGVRSTLELFAALEQPPPPPRAGGGGGPWKQLAVVMTYRDALPELSSAFLVVGFADASIKLVRQLLSLQAAAAASGGVSDHVKDEDNNLPLQPWTIAVHRGDGQYAKKLERYQVANSPKFARFMKRLQREGVVAILAPDKMQRFGILVPNHPSAHGSSDTDYTKEDFCATIYIGKMAKVKAYLTGGGSSATREGLEPSFVPTTPPMNDVDSGDVPVFRPPDSNGDTVWRPPADTDHEGSLWQPPGGDDSTNGFGTGDSAETMWRPPTESTSSNGFEDSAWRPPQQESGRKRSHYEIDDGIVEDNKFHADAGAAAADAFYSGLTRSLDTRADSRIFHMRAFNGWVKATQIQECNPRTKSNNSKGLRVLDLACGKGGDLGKWAHHKRGMQNYVGVDVARGSLKDAAIRVRKMRKRLNRCTFSCADLGHDVPGRLRSPSHTKMQKLLTWSLQGESEHESKDPVFTNAPGGGISLDEKFDVISVQFAIHYMMQTRRRARRFFQTASELLEIGGNLICTTIDARVVLDRLMDQGLDLHFDNGAELDQAEVTAGDGACRIQFKGEVVKRIFTKLSKPHKFDSEEMFGLEYTFTLVEGKDHGAGVGDAVNLPEWLTPIPMLEAVANDAGLELVSAENFHEFFHNRKDPSLNSAAHEAIANMKVLDRNGSIFADNWDISRMYCAINFRKVRESTMVLDEDGVLDEPDDEVEARATNQGSKAAVDPVKAKKMLPMAMMKAKKNVGADNWNMLSSDEKKRLTQIELENMLNPEW